MDHTKVDPYHQDLWNRWFLYAMGYTDLGLNPSGFQFHLCEAAGKILTNNEELDHLATAYPMLVVAARAYASGKLVEEYHEKEGV